MMKGGKSSFIVVFFSYEKEDFDLWQLNSRLFILSDLCDLGGRRKKKEGCMSSLETLRLS